MWALSSRGEGDKALVAGPLKKKRLPLDRDEINHIRTETLFSKGEKKGCTRENLKKNREGQPAYTYRIPLVTPGLAIY